ncbi:MAG: ASKHA domain-containing protein, partial [Desulfobacterales bacterium]|nr:ASKHA domain-containing protein [Desulfobacterales bacterium]
GCRAALLNRKKRDEANWCARNVQYLELTVEPTFEKDFTEAMQMPHMSDKFPHLEGVVPDHVLYQGPKGPVKPTEKA